MPTRPNPRAPAFPFPKASTATSGGVRSTWSSTNSPHMASPSLSSANSSHTPTPVRTGTNTPNKLSDSVGSLTSSASSFDMADLGTPASGRADASGRTSASHTSDEGGLASVNKRWTAAATYDFVPRAFTTPLNKQQPGSEADDATPKNTVPSTVKRIDIPNAATRFASSIAEENGPRSLSDSQGSGGLASGLYPSNFNAIQTNFGPDAFPQYAQTPFYGRDYHSRPDFRPDLPPFQLLGKSFENALRSDDSSDSSNNNDLFPRYRPGYHHPLAFARVPPPAVPTGALLHRQSAPDMSSQRVHDANFGTDNQHANQYGPINGAAEGSGAFAGRFDGRRGATDHIKRRTVHLHTVPAGMNSAQLRSFAERFGEVVQVKIGGDDNRMGVEPMDGKRHAYLLMGSHEQAINLLNGFCAQGLGCELAKEDWQTEYKAREDRNSSNIYVVGVPIEWSKDYVEDYMTQFGRVASLRLLEDQEGNRRGPILVRFDSRVQAERAIAGLDNSIHPVSGERMQARVADSDNQKDYKRLRSTADSAIDERRASMSTSEDASGITAVMGVDQLLAIREKYERKLQMVNLQLSSLSFPHNRSQAMPHRMHGSLSLSGGMSTRSRPDLNIAGGPDYRQRHLSHDWVTPPPTGYDALVSPATTQADILTPPPTLRHFSYGAPGTRGSPSRQRTMSASTNQAQGPMQGAPQPSNERRFATVGPSLARSLAASTSAVPEDGQNQGGHGGNGLWHARSASDLADVRAKEEEHASRLKSLWPEHRA